MFCSKCGAQLPDGSAFCGNCGNPIAPVAPVATTPVTPVAETPVAPVAPVTPVAETPVATAAPKKNRTALIVIIIVIVAVLGTAAALLFLTDTGKELADDWFGTSLSDSDDEDDDKNGDKDDEENDTDSGKKTTTTTNNGGYFPAPSRPTAPTAAAPGWDATTTTQTPTQDAPMATTPAIVVPDPNTYNAGYIAYDEYINEWANLCCSIKSDWELGTDAEYDTYKNSVTECGLYLKRFNDTTGAYDLINIVYEYMQGADISAADYMDVFTSNTESAYASMGYSVEISDPTELRYEGRNWVDCTIHLTEASLYQRYMVTEHDGYMISLIFTTKDSSALSSMLNKVKAIG